MSKIFPQPANAGWIGAMLCAFVPAVASATPADLGPAPLSLPGSPSHPGLGMSPEAPPTPPPPGSVGPAFGTPADPDAWAFTITGRISGIETVGFGRTPAYPASPDSPTGVTFHSPPRIVGRAPFWAGPGSTINFQYGNQTVTAFVSVEAGYLGAEWRQYHAGQWGPRMRTAYVAVNPAPFGDLRLRIQVGAFPANYGAPGPWGWGIFGPVLAIHGYGGIATGNYELAPNLNLYLEYGLAGVDAVNEAYPRGTFTDWPEVGISTFVNHFHAGLSWKNKYFAKLHLARANGRNLRAFLVDDNPSTPATGLGPDGRIDVAALETRLIADPYGQLGITPVYWHFENASFVHDGIWWGLDWTAGGREMTNKFLGPRSGGNGHIAAVSMEYDFSLKRILRAPEPFDGNGRDLRVAIAFLPFWTLKSADPAYDDTKGFFVGSSVEHVLSSWLSTVYYLFGESRASTITDINGNVLRGRWSAFSGTVGVAFHSDWQSQDRVTIAYSRYFYSDLADNNPALPLDRNVLTIGASMAF